MKCISCTRCKKEIKKVFVVDELADLLNGVTVVDLCEICHAELVITVRNWWYKKYHKTISPE